jgi:hypothetical protein
MLRELPRNSPANAVLPSYAHPPLVQVWLSLRVKEPQVIQPAVLIEQLGPAWMEMPAAKPIAESMTFRSVLGDLQLLVCPEEIHFRWDGLSGETYPHYESLRDGLLTAYDAWCRSIDDSAPTPASWQMSYRNRFPQGTVWQRLDDLRFCRLLTAGQESPLAAHLQDVQQRWTYRLPDPPTELQCDVWLERAAEEAIWLALTCSGSCHTEDDADWLANFDDGRRLIVHTFRGLMSAEANAYWGLLAETKKAQT